MNKFSGICEIRGIVFNNYAVHELIQLEVPEVNFYYAC